MQSGHAERESRYSEGAVLAFPGVANEGRQLSMEFTIVPLRGASRKMIGLSAIMRNVTERFEEMRALKRKLAEIDRQSEERGRARDLPQEANAFWQNQSFHNYADYAMSDELRSGLKMLRERGHVMTCAIMCSEVRWRCHRRIIADYLIASGEIVFHILGPGVVNRANLTDGARVGPDGIVSYPPRDAELDKNPAARL